MTEYIFETSLLVHAATLTYVLGFAFRNQIILRLLVLIGTIFYILYYYFHTADPLWDAIFGSVLIGVATAQGLVMLVYSRYPVGFSKTDREIFAKFVMLEPGQFRQLMKAGEMHFTSERMVLTHEDEIADQMYFVLNGSIEVRKNDSVFLVPDHSFVGEIGFVLDRPASATAVLPAGGSYIAWDRSVLSGLLERKPQLRQAFNALVTLDIAWKLSSSVRVNCDREGRLSSADVIGPTLPPAAVA
ncbi:MAG: cyclic nucleotide-binding domain-containing protein [Pseudomonadota bacterium]